MGNTDMCITYILIEISANAHCPVIAFRNGESHCKNVMIATKSITADDISKKKVSSTDHVIRHKHICMFERCMHKNAHHGTAHGARYFFNPVAKVVRFKHG